MNPCTRIVPLLLLLVLGFDYDDYTEESFDSGEGHFDDGEDSNYDSPDGMEQDEQDHYEVLGLNRDADASAIKRAYRNLALTHHPDKAAPVDAEAAHELFRRIALAYEILSNPIVKERYDQTGSSESEHNQQLDPNDRYYMSPEVERQQVRPQEVHNFEQLKQMSLDPSTGRLERSILVALVDQQDQHCLEFAAFGLKFPFPFAGWQELHFGADGSGPNLWWEDVLQTYTIQVYDEQMVNLFHTSSCPTIIFARKGQRLQDYKKLPYETLDNAPNNDVAGAFVGWVWDQMRTTVTVRNEHHSPVEVFEWQRGDANLVKVLKPGDKLRHKTAVSFEVFAREENTEGYTLSKNAALASLTVADWNGLELVIHTRCTDSHGDCRRLVENGSCKEDSALAVMCARSCELCSKQDQIGKRCADRALPCKSWAQEGHCTSSLDRMLSLCPLSCSKCTASTRIDSEL